MSVPMQVGDVRIAEDADFQKVKDMCQCHDDWKQEYNKNGITVWTKSNDVSDFKLVKVGFVKAHLFSQLIEHSFMYLVSWY